MVKVFTLGIKKFHDAHISICLENGDKKLYIVQTNIEKCETSTKQKTKEVSALEDKQMTKTTVTCKQSYFKKKHILYVNEYQKQSTFTNFYCKKKMFLKSYNTHLIHNSSIVK